MFSSMLDSQDILLKQSSDISSSSTLLRLRAALSLPPGVRFLNCTSRRSTSWTMAFTVKVMSPAWRLRLVCSANSLAMTAAVSPAFSCKKRTKTKNRSKLIYKNSAAKQTSIQSSYLYLFLLRHALIIHNLQTGKHDKLQYTNVQPLKNECRLAYTFSPTAAVLHAIIVARRYSADCTLGPILYPEAIMKSTIEGISPDSLRPLWN